MFVILTIDVECYSGDYSREVYAEGLGLEYILRVLRERGVRATFFVEALGATRWGTEGLRGVCARILEDGQDLQLHIHPVVAQLDGFEDQYDVLWMHDLATQERLIRVGLETLRSCGAGAVTAFRAGDFAANEDTLRAMERAGLFLGSNRNLDTKTSIRSRVNGAFPITNDYCQSGRVFDLPVTSLKSPFPLLDGPCRHMEISAMGQAEMTDGLERMLRAGYGCATLLTHPGEFFYSTARGAVPVVKNRRRLEALLDYVKATPGVQFLTVEECPSRMAVPARQPPALTLKRRHSLARVAEQVAERLRRRLLT